jgi:hypothetical protein
LVVGSAPMAVVTAMLAASNSVTVFCFIISIPLVIFRIPCTYQDACPMFSW